MKKKIIMFAILIIIILINFLISNQDKKENLEKDICKIETFTLTDNGTEIEISIDSKDYINRVKIYLYDSNSQKIKTINKTINKKIKCNEIIKIKDRTMYPETSNATCEIYKSKS